LVAEVDVWLTDKKMRRPDVAYYDASQLRQMANGEQVVPSLAVEFVSENDDIRKYIKKLNEYFQAGVKVVWLVFSNDQTVYIYTSSKP
jgi:Uma2 family endonuclease